MSQGRKGKLNYRCPSCFMRDLDIDMFYDKEKDLLVLNKDNKYFFEKLFLNLDYEAQSMFTPNFNDGLNKMINVIDINKLNIQSKFSIAYVLDIIEAVLMSNIVKSYKRNLSKEKNIEVFEKELALICAGIMKK